MISKAISVTVFVFWGIMTSWLVKTIYFPDFERLPEVDPAHVLNQFLQNDEVTHLFIYGADKVIGDGMLSSRLKDTKSSEAEIRFVGKGKLEFPNAETKDLNLRVTVSVGPSPKRELKEVSFKIQLKDPDVMMVFKFNTISYDFDYQIFEDGEVIADSKEGNEKAEIKEARELLKLMRMNSNANPQVSQRDVDARWGAADVDGYRTPVYFLVFDIPGGGRIKFTISEAGEFLEMTTPFGYDVRSKVMM